MATSIGTRMKAYEDCYNYEIPNGFSTILRVDGRAFHTFTKNFYKPFDTLFMTCMRKAALYLCENITGARFAYMESDEISILIDNPYEEGQVPWFGNRVQKIASVAASMATLAFNKAYSEEVANFKKHYNDPYMISVYESKLNTATFDARIFVVPEEDIPNYFLWRQQDAERNSIQMIARSLYSHKEVYGKKTSELHEMLYNKGQNWAKYPDNMKRGSLIMPFEKTCYHGEIPFTRKKWGIESAPNSNTYEEWQEIIFINRI